MTELDRPDILYLVHRIPFPPDKGDRIRAFQVLRYLSARANVHLACLADEPTDSSAVAALRKICRRVAVVPLGAWRWVRALVSLVRGQTVTQGAFSSPELRAVLRAWVKETRFHAVLASASSMVPYLQLPELNHLPAVVDLVDVDSLKWSSYVDTIRGPKKWLYGLESRRLQRLEKAIPDWARAVTLVSEAEANLYRGLCPTGSIQAVRNGVDLDFFQTRLPTATCAGSANGSGQNGQTCVFVGALDYWPNVQGITWFCREVWPEIHRSRPDTQLTLVGRRPVPEVQRLGHLPGVSVLGQVPDVRPHLAKATLVVVPLNLARGIQNKVLEALAMGKATVVSPGALEGLDAEDGVHLLAASNPTEWIRTVVGLLDNPQMRQTLGAAGRCFVEQHHRWEKCLAPFDQLLDLPLR